MQRGSLIPIVFLPRQVEFAHLSLRHKFLSYERLSFDKFKTESLYQILRLKQFFVNNLLLKYTGSLRILFLVQKYLNRRATLKRVSYLFKLKRLKPRRVYKAPLVRRAKYQFFKRFRLLKLRRKPLVVYPKQPRLMSLKFATTRKTKRSKLETNKTRQILIKKNISRARLIKKTCSKFVYFDRIRDTTISNLTKFGSL